MLCNMSLQGVSSRSFPVRNTCPALLFSFLYEEWDVALGTVPAYGSTCAYGERKREFHSTCNEDLRVAYHF